MYTTTHILLGRHDLEVKLGITFTLSRSYPATWESPAEGGELDIEDMEVIHVESFNRKQFEPTEASAARLLRCLSASQLESINEACGRAAADSQDDEPDYDRESYFDRMRRTL
jgi:hypothetical protein